MSSHGQFGPPPHDNGGNGGDSRYSNGFSDGHATPVYNHTPYGQLGLPPQGDEGASPYSNGVSAGYGAPVHNHSPYGPFGPRAGVNGGDYPYNNTFSDGHVAPLAHPLSTRYFGGDSVYSNPFSDGHAAPAPHPSGGTYNPANGIQSPPYHPPGAYSPYSNYSAYPPHATCMTEHSSSRGGATGLPYSIHSSQGGSTPRPHDPERAMRTVESFARAGGYYNPAPSIPLPPFVDGASPVYRDGDEMSMVTSFNDSSDGVAYPPNGWAHPQGHDDGRSELGPPNPWAPPRSYFQGPPESAASPRTVLGYTPDPRQHQGIPAYVNSPRGSQGRAEIASAHHGYGNEGQYTPDMHQHRGTPTYANSSHGHQGRNEIAPAHGYDDNMSDGSATPTGVQIPPARAGSPAIASRRSGPVSRYGTPARVGSRAASSRRSRPRSRSGTPMSRRRNGNRRSARSRSRSRSPLEYRSTGYRTDRGTFGNRRANRTGSGYGMSSSSLRLRDTVQDETTPARRGSLAHHSVRRGPYGGVESIMKFDSEMTQVHIDLQKYMAKVCATPQVGEPNTATTPASGANIPRQETPDAASHVEDLSKRVSAVEETQEKQGAKISEVESFADARVAKIAKHMNWLVHAIGSAGDSPAEREQINNGIDTLHNLHDQLNDAVGVMEGNIKIGQKRIKDLEDKVHQLVNKPQSGWKKTATAMAVGLLGHVVCTMVTGTGLEPPNCTDVVSRAALAHATSNFERRLEQARCQGAGDC